MEGAEGGQEGIERERQREWAMDKAVCFWSIQVSVLFDEDKVKC